MEIEISLPTELLERLDRIEKKLNSISAQTPAENSGNDFMTLNDIVREKLIPGCNSKSTLYKLDIPGKSHRGKTVFYSRSVLMDWLNSHISDEDKAVKNLQKSAKRHA